MASVAPITIKGPYPERFTKPARAPRTEGWMWKMEDELHSFGRYDAMRFAARRGVPESMAEAYLVRLLVAQGARA